MLVHHGICPACRLMPCERRQSPLLNSKDAYKKVSFALRVTSHGSPRRSCRAMSPEKSMSAGTQSLQRLVKRPESKFRPSRGDLKGCHPPSTILLAEVEPGRFYQWRRPEAQKSIAQGDRPQELLTIRTNPPCRSANGEERVAKRLRQLSSTQPA